MENNSTEPVRKESDLLAFQRTILAQERTLMAWVRTSLSMISFGFTIYKFFGELKKDELLPQDRQSAPRNFGLILVTLGTLFLIIATIQHDLIIKDLRIDGLKSRVSLPFFAAILISILGLFILINILFHIGPLR